MNVRPTADGRAHVISDSKTMNEYTEYMNPRLKFAIGGCAYLSKDPGPYMSWVVRERVFGNKGLETHVNNQKKQYP